MLSTLENDRDAFYLDRLIRRLMAKQELYQTREDYVVGNHPLPNGDPRFRRALREIQRKAKTNYVGLANRAVTERMRVRAFKFSGKLDKEAMRLWKANNMALNASIAVSKAARLSDVYALVSPPREEGGEPVISIEDPRVCIIEPDPIDPYRASVGLKFYEDTVSGLTYAILYYPETVNTYVGPALNDFLAREETYSPENIVNSSGGFELVSVQPNPIGEVPLVRGAWQPEFGLRGMAECEDGGWDIQDRINTTVLLRMVIGNSQAFRQRWMTGAKVARSPDGSVKQTPFEPGADLVWAVQDPNAKFGDFEQADIKQLLEAIRDDVGDFAAITQTPVTYLTNKMVNVSASTMTAAQSSLISKVKARQESMGWFFEQIIKLCFRYKGDERATDVEAETIWVDPEMRTMAEIADMVAKFAAAGVPISLILERANFTPEEVEFATAEFERLKQEEREFEAEQADKQMAARQQAAKPTGSGSSSGQRNK